MVAAFAYTETTDGYGSCISAGTDVANKMTCGTYTSSGGATGGAITTGLATIRTWYAQSSGSATAVYGSVSGGTITITTAANDTGYWEAWGV